MDQQRFDDLIRSFAHRDTGRRGALRLVITGVLGLAGVVSAGDVDAHNALKRCRKIEDKKKRAKCVKAAKKHNAKHRNNQPPPEPECDPPCPARQGCTKVSCIEGECVLLSEPAAAGETCRPVAGACDFVETCDGKSLHCPSDRFRPSTVQCRTAKCLTESTLREAAFCTGSTPDCPGSPVRDCGRFRCMTLNDTDSCIEQCGNDGVCVNGAWCNSGTCVAKQPDGTACSAATPNQCLSGHCVAGTCCNRQCPAPPNATATCPGGNCSFVCHQGFANCNGNLADGCEVDLRSDPDHCGSCDAPPCQGTCGNFNQGTRECINGTCECVINP